MNNILIRKAKQNYVCDCCGHIIKNGEEYLDKVILNTGKVVRHERYHDECPYSDDDKQNKFIRKFLVSKDIIAKNKFTHEKFRVISINNGPTLCVGLLDWGWNRVPDVSIKTFLENYDYE